MQTQTAEKPRKRRGRPPKARPEESSRAPARLPRPSAPALAQEIVDHVLSRYEWGPADWRTVLTSLAYVQRLGRYWAQQTRKQ